MTTELPRESPVVPHPPGKPEFAFGGVRSHKRGEPWWLTDGYGYGTKVSFPVWLYYRATRKRRSDRFNREMQAGRR